MEPMFTGTGVALITPFDENGNIDLAGLRKVTEHVIKGGVDYLVPMGTTAESVTLTAEETDACIKTILETNNKRLPVLLGCGGNDTAAVAHKMEMYGRKYDIQGFLSVSPYYNRPQQEGIYQHFKLLSTKTTLPIIIYNVPARTGSNILPETVIRLAKDCPTIIGVKEASGSLEQGAKIIKGVPPEFLVISGDDGLALPGMALGYMGLISVAANVVPKGISDMIRAALSQNFIQARKLHYEVLQLVELLFKEGSPAGVKAACAAANICGANPRLPIVPVSAGLRNEIENCLKMMVA